MASSTFMPQETLYAFVSVGEQRKMFTLRTMLKGLSYYQGIPYTDYATQYHKNLGTDLAESITKAKAFAENQGLAFRVSAEAKNDDLHDITRLTPAELDHRKWEQERDRLAKEAEAQAKAEQRHNELSKLEWSMDSMCAFGKYRDTKTIGQLVNDDPEYLCWLFDNNELPIKQLKNRFHAQLNWIHANVQRPTVKPVVSGWIAENEGEKLKEVKARCDGAYYRRMEVGYNQVAIIFEYELTEVDSGKQIIIKYSGNAWNMEEGKTYSFDGKVKELAEWKGVKRTILNYVKNVKEI